VTAAGSGIGLAAARALLREGARVFAVDRDLTGLPEEAGLIRYKADLTDPGVPGEIASSAIGEFGQIDVLVNGLGAAAHREGFLGVSDADWSWSISVNLLPMVRLTRSVLPSMRAARSGSVINIASDSGRQPHPMFVDYSAMKAAILSLTKSLSIEFGGDGIRVNAVSPGPTRTPGFVQTFTADIAPAWNMSATEAMDHFVHEVQRIPMGRLGEGGDVAGVILFLASGMAGHVTGSEYCVDGGVIRGC
jgi:NAD(P)-dependent dehydrogenase (short-subunit alcohol dehydrogenase family)